MALEVDQDLDVAGLAMEAAGDDEVAGDTEEAVGAGEAHCGVGHFGDPMDIMATHTDATTTMMIVITVTITHAADTYTTIPHA